MVTGVLGLGVTFVHSFLLIPQPALPLGSCALCGVNVLREYMGSHGSRGMGKVLQRE